MMAQHRPRLSICFSVLVIFAIAIASAIYIPWCTERSQSLSEKKALAEARTLNQEMSAAWDYVNSIQNQINYDATGRYDFKNVYCAIAGKAIAQRFMLESEYSIAYVRQSPRSVTDTPDGFEVDALQAFAASDTSEYYGLTTGDDGSTVFRYVSVLRYDDNCLTCHGTPAGDKDETGFLKEGMSLGDIAGAASITIPMGLYEDEIQANTVTDIAFFLLLILLIVAIISVAMNVLIAKPLKRLSQKAKATGEGDWQVDCSETHAPKEIRTLSNSLSTMGRQLKELYGSLEEKVEQRTAQLQAANGTLEEQERKIEETNSALKASNERLSDEVAYKSSFLSMMSHELKTPIASLTAATEIWLRSNPEADEVDREFAEEIRAQCSRLLDTVDNALDTTRIESGRFIPQIQQIDPLDILDAVESSISTIAQKKSIELICPSEPDIPIIESDWDSLTKILGNIASNAVKFTGEGGHIAFDATWSAEDDTVTISIADDGIGIAPSDQGRIFERFIQVDPSLSREYHGSGLGLSLAKDLAEQIGATIALESEPGVGSTFHVIIPVHWTGNGPKSGGTGDDEEDGDKGNDTKEPSA